MSEQDVTANIRACPPAEQFQLFFQPQYQLEDDALCAAEVQAYWHHPKKGVLPPDAFLAEFAENGFSYPLDDIVLEKTCQTLKAWMERGMEPLPLAVRLLGRTPFRPQWTQWLRSMLARYGVSPALLRLEMREESYLGSPRATHALVSELQNAQIDVALDNFGCGMTSAKTLNGMGAKILNADMRFFVSSDNLGQSEMLLGSLIKSARWMGMTVVAEYAETQQQKDFALACGCHLIQGRLYAEPVSAAEFENDYLPLYQGERAAAAKEGGEAVGRSRTILVIDDSEMERALVKKYLGSEYHIHESENAEQAIAYLEKKWVQVRLSLVDNMMPGINGIEFLRYCEGFEDLHRIPKIMITSSNRADDQKQAFRAGAYDFLAKPLIPEVVQARVQHAMELNRELRAFESNQERFRRQADTDRATGLLNKAAFEDAVEKYLVNHETGPCHLFVMDVDNFKAINDQFGHLHGDEVLKVIASTLQQSYRKSDLIGRFGGDEFVICLTAACSHALLRQKWRPLCGP